MAALGVAAALLRATWPIAQAFFDEPSLAAGDLIVMGFVALFVLFGVNAVYGLIFELFGIEELTIKENLLRLRRTALGAGHRAAYDVSQVANLRILDLTHGLYVRGIAVGPSRNGLLVFDHGERLIRFGDDLKLPEAAFVRDLVQVRLDQALAFTGAA